MLLLGYAVMATILGSRRVCRRCGKKSPVSKSQPLDAVLCQRCAGEKADRLVRG